MSTLATILRRSAASAAPFARRFTATRVIVTPALFSSLNGTSPSAFTGETRRFCTAVKVSKPSSDESLLRVIESEINCAAELEGQEVLETPANFPFEIQDNPGLQTISLTREYEGELIKVEVHVSNLITGDEDDDNADGEIEKGNESSIPLVVRVSKKSGGKCLEFGCTAFPDEIAIDSLTIKNPENRDDQIPYEGPDFNDLDENLQKAFMKYLEIRGIKPSTTNFLHEYMLNKDSREYLVWLKNVKNFIQK